MVTEWPTCISPKASIRFIYEITNVPLAIKSVSRKKKDSLKMNSIYGLRSGLILLSILHVSFIGKPYR